jgi:hypothetical protein
MGSLTRNRLFTWFRNERGWLSYQGRVPQENQHAEWLCELSPIRLFRSRPVCLCAATMTPNLLTSTREHSSGDILGNSDQVPKWTCRYLHSLANSRTTLALLLSCFPLCPAGSLCRGDAPTGSRGHRPPRARPAPKSSRLFVTKTVECGERRINLFDGLLCALTFRSQIRDDYPHAVVFAPFLNSFSAGWPCEFE